MNDKGVIYIRPGGQKPTAEELEACEAVVLVSEPFQRDKLMIKTTANPDRLVHRAQRYVTRLENELTILSGILKTLAAAIKQGDVAVSDPGDITGRLRWVEHQEAGLCASLDSVIAQTSELMRQLDAACPPLGVSLAQDPSMEYPTPSLSS